MVAVAMLIKCFCTFVENYSNFELVHENCCSLIHRILRITEKMTKLDKLLHTIGMLSLSNSAHTQFKSKIKQNCEALPKCLFND